ncbi:hypothetical protein ACWKSP_04880 [Micromonosporaceae bacterium Da 78-11]
MPAPSRPRPTWSWTDRTGIALGVTLVAAVVLAVAYQVARFGVVLVRDARVAVPSLLLAGGIVLAFTSARNGIAATVGARTERLRSMRFFLVRHDPDGYRELLTLLRRRARRTRPVALALLDEPQLVDGLIFHARRGHLRAELQPFADRVRGDARPDPVALVFASVHADGHVREAAVAAMAARPRPEYVPFLVERAVEWVEPVRARALATLHDLLTAEPGTYRPLIIVEFPRVAARRHAPALAALLPSPAG